nr:unnamed protein product [Callosobruchus chinensis]
MEYAFLKGYNLTSFSLLIIRIAAVIIFGSGVNEEWRKIRSLLDSVTHCAYNIEVCMSHRKAVMVSIIFKIMYM